MWLTVLDSRSAYWAILVQPDDHPKTAFTDGNSLFQFWCVPFGLSTTPTTFQLASVLGCYTFAYLDDVIITSYFDSHLQDL